MRPTRRYWAAVGVAVLLAAAAVLFDRPALLVGAAAFGGWLIATAYAFLRTVAAVDAALDVAVSPSTTHTVVDDDVEVTLRADAIETGATVTVRLRLPAGLLAADPAERTAVRLREDGPAATTVAVHAPVAGRFTLPRPSVTVTDAGGLFVESFARGPKPALTVESRRPRDVTVGSGEDAPLSPGGEHVRGQRGGGIEPAEVRRYVPGEAADSIDWNATARLADTYVREFETEAAIRTAFVVDARASSGVGPPGETAFDYLREVALGMLALSRSFEDPVGLAVVDDDGLAALQQPTTTAPGYQRLRRRLHAAAPDGGRGARGLRPQGGASLARRLSGVEPGDDSVFLGTLARCVEGRRPLPADRSPLRASVRALGSAGTPARTVFFADDTRRRELREAVERARGHARGVTVFLAPTVLFEPNSFSDLPAAYDRYREFEAFRQDLDRLDRVDVHEVGPGDRAERLRATRRPETG